MLKSVLCIFILGAFLHGTNADIDCFVKKMQDVSIFQSIGEGSTAICNGVKDIFKEIRNIIKICEVPKISIDGFEKLLDDFCVGDSDLVKEWVDSQMCLMLEMSKLKTCMPQVTQTTIVVEAVKEECKYRGKIIECFRSIGKPCGAEKLVNRFTDTYDSYLQGVCAQVGGDDKGGKDGDDKGGKDGDDKGGKDGDDKGGKDGDDKGGKDGDDKGGKDGDGGGASVNKVFTWTILLGFIFVSIMWR